MPGSTSTSWISSLPDRGAEGRSPFAAGPRVSLPPAFIHGVEFEPHSWRATLRRGRIAKCARPAIPGHDRACPSGDRSGFPASVEMTGAVRLRRTGGLVVDSPQDEGCPLCFELPGIPLCQRGTERVGARGLEARIKTGLAGIAHPPATHHGQAMLRPCHPSGRAEGRSPSAFSSIPHDRRSVSGRMGGRGLITNYAKRQIPGHSIAGGSSDTDSGESLRLYSMSWTPHTEGLTSAMLPC